MGLNDFDRLQQLVMDALRSEYRRLGLAAAFSVIRSKRSPADRRLDLVLTIPKLFARQFAWDEESNSVTGNTYVFNGRYYEPVAWMTLSSSLLFFLREPDESNPYGKCQSSDMDPMLIDSVYRKQIYSLGVMHNPIRTNWNVFCFENCVVDFETGMRMDFVKDGDTWRADEDIPPELRTRKFMDFVYDRRDILRTPLWRSFLRQTFPKIDEEGKIDLLQMFLGASLIDRKKHKFEYFLLMQGNGRNGKSLIRDVVQDVFGSGDMVDFSIPQIEGNGTDKSNNRYAVSRSRFLWLSESSRGEFKNSETLKRMVSYEKYSVHKKYEDSRNATHAPLILCNSNYLFKSTDFVNKDNPADIALRRRVRILNFCHTVPLEKMDTGLRTKLYVERAGIFAWIVKGMEMLKRNGYRLPDVEKGPLSKNAIDAAASIKTDDGAVRAVVCMYLQDKKLYHEVMGMDDERKWSVFTSDLYENFVEYCKTNGMEPVSSNKFGRDMRSMGFKWKYDPIKRSKRMYTIYASYPSLDALVEDVPIHKGVDSGDYDTLADDIFVAYSERDKRGKEQ